jgi:hypothetical protein
LYDSLSLADVNFKHPLLAISAGSVSLAGSLKTTFATLPEALRPPCPQARHPDDLFKGSFRHMIRLGQGHVKVDGVFWHGKGMLKICSGSVWITETIDVYRVCFPQMYAATICPQRLRRCAQEKIGLICTSILSWTKL